MWFRVTVKNSVSSVYENGKKGLIRNGQLISKLGANVTLMLVKQAHLWSDSNGKQQPLEVSEWTDLYL